MNFLNNFKSRRKYFLALSLVVLLSLSGFAATTAFATDLNAAAPLFSKLQLDRSGNLYGLGPQQKTLFRIQPGKTGLATQQLFSHTRRITGFATSDNGFVLVSKGSVWMLDRAGKDLHRIGSDDKVDRLSGPIAVAYSNNHRIYVAESGNDRVSVFGRNGVYLFSFGDTGPHNARLKNPFAVFVDQTEKIYVLDEREKGRINIYTAGGHWLRSLASGALQIAPFARETRLAPVVDQKGNLLALGADGKNFILYDWQQNKRQLIEHVTAPGVYAIAFGQDRLITEIDNVVRSHALDVSTPTAGSAPILDNVTGNTIPAPSCTQAYVLPGREVLCLHRNQGSLVKYSADGKPQVRYGGVLQKPSLLAWSKNEVAVADNHGIKIFQLSGKLVNEFDQYKNPQALGFAGERLVLINNGKAVIVGKDGSVATQDNTVPASSINKQTRFLAFDSLQNIYTADRGEDRVYVNNLQSGQSYTISRPEISNIGGLGVDGNDQLYILAKHRDGGQFVHVYRGLSQRFSFHAGRDYSMAGFSVMASADTLISIYNKRDSSFRQFQYQQVPSEVINLKVKPGAAAIALSWLRSAEPFVDRYGVEAAVSAGGPFTDVAATRNTQLEIRLADRRYRYFRVSALARSGITGYPSETIDNQFESGYQAYRDKNFAAAVDRLRKLSLAETENAAALQYLGRSLIAIGEYDRALSVLRQLQGLEGQSTVAKTLQAEALFRAERYSLADRTISAIKTENTVDAEQLEVCARIKLALGNRKGASVCLNKLISTQPENFDARLLQLSIFDPARQRGAIKSQLVWLSSRARKEKKAEQMLSLANYFFDTGKYGDATTWYQRSLKIRPGNTVARTGLVRAAIKQKHFSEARRIALSMIGNADQQLEGYRQLGDVALSQNRPGEAVLSYRKAASLEPSNMAAQLGLANAFRRLKNFSQAKEALSVVLQGDPMNAVAHLELAQIHLAESEIQEAIRELDKVVRYQPQNSAARDLLVDTLETSGELHAATMQALALNQVSPSDSHARKLADLYFKQGRLHLALAQYRSLLHKHRNSVELNVRVGAIYHRLGQNVLARKVLEKATRLNSKSESAQTELARVYSDLQLYKAALRSANKALKLNPGADNRLLLESIRSDRDEYLRNKRRGASLVIDKLVLDPVYSTALSQQKASIGSLSITNRTSRDITDITLRLYVGDFVDAGMVLSIPLLKAKASEEVPLRINLSSHIEELSEDQLKTVDVELGFSDQQGSRLIEKNGILRIYGRYAADWNSELSMSRFLQLPHGLVGSRPAHLDDDLIPGEILPVYLAPLVEAYSNISGYGIVINPAPTTEKRYLQYPVETLDRRQGSAADLTMMIASYLLSGGKRVALAGSAESPLLLVSTGVSWELRASLELNDSAIYNFDGQAWIPFAMSEWPNGIAAMWSAGIKRVSGPNQKIVVNELQANPVTNVNDSASETTPPDEAWTRWYRQRELYDLQSFLMVENGQGIESKSPLKQARWYLQKKYYRHAINSFAAALLENPYSYDAILGTGDAYTALGSINRAVNFYRRASYLEPFDQSSLSRELQILKQLGLDARIDRLNKKIEALTSR